MFRQKKYFENYVLTKKYGTSYFYATLLLPKKSRRHIYSLYSLCRYADDLVDVDDDKPGLRKDAKEAINSFYAEVKDSIIKNVKTTEFIDEIAKTWRELDLPIEFLDRFFHSMLMDLEVGKYDTYDDLLVYMDGSAAVIGEMVIPVLKGNLNPNDLIECARALGNAFQLTNFIRDVGEDLHRGRTYIPQKDIYEYGVDPNELIYGENYKKLIQFEIDRNLELYEQAYAGVIALKGRQGACVRTAYRLYGSILKEVIHNDYDNLSKRARVPKWKKIAILLRELMRVNRTSFKKNVI